MESYQEALSQAQQLIKFCNKYGLYEFKLQAKGILVDIYVETGDIGEAMLVLSQLIASLEQFTDQFAYLKVEASY